MFTAIAILIALDILTGLFNAIMQKKLTSKRSYIGMFKKVAIFAVVLVAFIVEDHLHVQGAGEMVSTFFIITESLSILENLKTMGIPLPHFLTDVIQKKNDDKDEDKKGGDKDDTE